MLNVGRLRVLTEVIGRGSFSAAAEALSYTQSAVSQAIARLEAETGTTLVVRDRQGIRATAAGATLVEHAETIFAQIDAAETDLAAVLGVRAFALVCFALLLGSAGMLATVIGSDFFPTCRGSRGSPRQGL